MVAVPGNDQPGSERRSRVGALWAKRFASLLLLVLLTPFLGLVWASRRPLCLLPLLAATVLMGTGSILRAYPSSSLGLPLFLLGGALVCPFVAFMIGSVKDRPVLGFILGLVLQPLGPLVIALVSPKR